MNDRRPLEVSEGDGRNAVRPPHLGPSPEDRWMSGTSPAIDTLTHQRRSRRRFWTISPGQAPYDQRSEYHSVRTCKNFQSASEGPEPTAGTDVSTLHAVIVDVTVILKCVRPAYPIVQRWSVVRHGLT